MTLRTRVDPIDRDIQAMLSDLSPAEQSKVFAQFAQDQIDQAKATNRQVLGRDPKLTVTVDGRDNAPLASVRPNGVIVAEFKLIEDVLIWIGDQLEKHSPVKSGRYRSSHVLLADGVEVDRRGNIPHAEEYVFINTQPYARKIESGSSSRAPQGVYQAVASLSRRFGNVAKVSFSYRVPLFGAVQSWAQSGSRGSSSRAEWKQRQPAIIVRMM